MKRWGRLGLVALAGLIAAGAAAVLAVVVNLATGGTAGWFPFPSAGRHPLWWMSGATAAVALASLLVWAAQRWYERGLSVPVPAAERLEPWVVERPDQVGQIVAALKRGGGTVGITTAVQGAGGFGKTTVARMVRTDRRVLRRFRGQVYWVTLGRDVGRQTLAGLVNGLIMRLAPDRAVTFTDARQASEHLAAVLAAGPRRLLVIDDVSVRGATGRLPGRWTVRPAGDHPDSFAWRDNYRAGARRSDVRAAGSGAATDRAPATPASNLRGVGRGDRTLATAASLG